MQAGTYVLKFNVLEAEPPLLTTVTVHVVGCSVGDVTTVTGDACQTCERGYYSFDPRNNTCDWCVPNAECAGGANILTAPGYWRSAPRSIQMHM